MQLTAQETQPANRYDRLFQLLIVVIIVTGVTLRASKYLPAWSMRGDELAVTRNLLSRSTVDLVTKPLDDEQAAPFGFLLATRFLMAVLGSSEYVLRAISFITGCLALLLMYRLLGRVTGEYGTLFTMAAFAFAYYPIYYAAELKQYSSDILVCIVLILFFLRHISRETNSHDFWQLGAVGVLAISFSHPAIFVLMGVGLTLFIHYWKDKQRLLSISLAGVVWAGFFLAIYWILLRHQTTSEYLVTFWHNLDSFMPIPPWENPIWFFQATRHLFTTLSGFPPNGMLILAPLYLYGQWLFFREKKWQWIAVTTIPIMINMLVSGFEKFPFHGRLIIYLLPLIYIVYAKGVQGLIVLIRNRAAANTVYIALLASLILLPAVSTTGMFLVTKSYLKDDMKPVLSYMTQNIQDGDLIYLYHYTSKQFDYYAPQYKLDDRSVIRGQDRSRNGRKYFDDLAELPRGQRIWFLFSFVGDTKINKTQKVNERDFILDYLEENGNPVQEFYSANQASSIHLFILR